MSKWMTRPRHESSLSWWALGRLARIGRIFFGVALLGWVLSRARWGELLGLQRQVQVGWLALFVLAPPTVVGLSAWKWRVLLQAAGYRVRFVTLFGLYLLGQFYNNLVPSSVGGDAVRGVILGRRIGSVHDAMGAIVVERFVGLMVLVAIVLAVVVLAGPLREHVPLMSLTGAGLMFSGGVMLAVLDPHALRGGRWCFGRFELTRKPIEKLQRFQQSLWAYRHHRLALARAVLLSLGFYAGAIANVYLACRSLGEAVPWWTVAAVTPMALLATMLPVSFNGVGVREWVFMAAFQLMGVSPALGVAASLMVRFNQLLWSCGGMLIYLTLPRRLPDEQKAVE